MLESGDLSAQSTAELISGGLMAAGGLLLFWTLSALVWVVYTIWVGVLASDPRTTMSTDLRRVSAVYARRSGFSRAPPAQG
jgi:hypothetical protein